MRYSISDLNNLLVQILFAYVEKESTDNINQFLITFSQQKLLDKVLVTKEIWSICYSLEQHKESSIESEILVSSLQLTLFSIKFLMGTTTKT